MKNIEVQNSQLSESALREIGEVTTRFMKRVKRLPELNHVILDTNTVPMYLQTVIEAPLPDNKYYHKVLDAEFKATEGHPDVLLNFRIKNKTTNPAEVPEEPIDGVQVLWQRSPKNS